MQEQYSQYSPILLGITLLVVIFCVELAVMFLLETVVPKSTPIWMDALIDAGVLTAVVSLFMWRLFINPLRFAMMAEASQSSHFRAVLNTAVNAIIIITEHGTIESCNSAAERIFGYQSGELAGKNIKILMPEPYAREHEGYVARYVRTGEAHLIGRTRELKALRKDGAAFPIELSVAEFYIQSGERRFTSVILDITERNRSVAALRESEERFRTIFDRALDGIVATDIATQMLRSANPQFCRMLGYSPEEIGRLGVADIHPEQELQHVREQFEKIARSEIQIATDIPVKRKDGSVFYADVTASIVRFGSGDCVVGILRDITERKRSDEALRLSDQRLQEAVRASGIGIYDHDQRTDTIYWSPRQRENFGWGPDEPVTLQRFVDHVHPEDRERIAADVRHAHDPASDGRFDVEHRIVRRDGEIRWLRTRSQTFFEGEGKERRAVRTIGAVLDITKSKLLEEARIRSQKLESLGTLAGGIAHDFNNILQAIRGNADLAAQDVGPDHIAAQSLEEIRKASARASELVRRIMAFGRPNEEQQAVVELGTVVSEVLNLLRSTLPASISLRQDFAKNTPHVLADAGQVHEAIVNLTTNAAYAIGTRAGSIEYRLEPVQVGEELAQSMPGIKEGRYARLTVTDSGCGMDPDTLERIFDAFYTTKPVGEGTGLGLSMVYGTMRSHGGAVTVENSPGKGSIFALYFPAATEKAQEEGQGAPAQVLLSVGKRVLYVDDEEALVLLASRVLSRLGHQISSFTDPKEALAAFRARPQDYDVVVTDLSMPQMSGFEFAGQVLGVRPGMPVLMMTGHVRADDETNARTIGIREVILKPTTMDDLCRILNQIIRDGERRGKPSV